MMRSLSEPWLVPMRRARPQLLAAPHQRGEALVEALPARGVLRVGVFADGEFLFVGVVAGIDAHLLDPLDRLHRGLGQEMDVGDERHIAATIAQSPEDMLEM